MSDLIRKKDAIDAIESTDWYHINRNGEMVHGANDALHQAWQKADEIHKAIESIPSAEPSVGYVGVDDDYLVSVKEVLNITAETGALETQRRVKELPRRDRAQGEWIFKPTFPNDKSEFPMGSLVCSVCGSHHSNSTPCNYCDNCGARMKGTDDGR